MQICFKISVLAVVLSGLAAPALARLDPVPKPSGIVVHLFGPGSITSNVMPTGPAASGSAQARPYVEPTMHDVLHQMFVTGDPNEKQGEALARGRSVVSGQ